MVCLGRPYFFTTLFPLFQSAPSTQFIHITYSQFIHMHLKFTMIWTEIYQYFFHVLPIQNDILLLQYHIQEVMSRKIKHDQYEVYVNFTSNNCMSITAEFMPTGEHFINNSAQLMRINKQTVFASLERKSQKHLRCEFEQQFQDGKKQLVIVFIVNFDFLPEFKQEIKLEYVDQKQSLKGLNLINMQSQIAEMQKSLDSMISNESSTMHQETSVTFNTVDKKQVWSKEVNSGKYIVRCSGVVNNPTGVQSNQKLCIYVSPPDQQQQNPIQLRTYHQSGYHFPFFASEIVDCKDGTLKVQMSSSALNSTGLTVHVIINRVIEAN